MKFVFAAPRSPGTSVSRQPVGVLRTDPDAGDDEAAMREAGRWAGRRASRSPTTGPRQIAS
jgi:hypothetical protein